MKTSETNIEKVKATDLELRAVFEVEQGGKSQTLYIRKDRIVIGSVESADIKLDGADIAPIHAFIELKWAPSVAQCEARIVDLASPAGVLLNGKKVVNETIRSGDLLQVGKTIVKFKIVKPDFQKPLPDKALLLIDASEVISIFDYRPPVKEALEIVYSWNNVILDVRHFVGKDALTSSTFSNGSNVKFEARGTNEWAVQLEPGMKGTLYLNGALKSVEDSVGSTVILGENDFIKIQTGGVNFFLSQTVAPPVLKNHGAIFSDPFLAKSLLTSVVLTAFMLFAVSRMEVPQQTDQPVPETIATILYHPEKYSIKHRIPEPPKKEAEKTPPEPEKPKKAEIDFTKPKEKEGKVAQTKSNEPGKKVAGQNQSKEGAGARAKGNEGSRGSKNAASSATKQSAANRPSPEAGAGRGGTTSQTADNGNVQMLKGATNKILDLLGGSGQKLGNSGSKLQGFGGFSTQGNGGLALQGQGKGGGGNADTLLGGTSDHGRGGGKVGTGLGAEGTGAGIVGGKTRVELNTGGGDETVVVGSIDRDAIDAAIKAHRDEFRYCHEREMNAGHPTLAGKIVAAFVIGGSGRASQLAVASSSMGSPNVERCVLSVLTRIQFPLPGGGVPVTIKYPFAYSNSSK